MRKYLNKRVEAPDGIFDSAKEYRRWCELKLLEKAGKIRDLQRQVRKPLIVNGVKVADLIVDFAYREASPHGDHAVEVFEDVKSDFTRKLPVWRLKSKMFAAIYGQPVREV